MKRPFSVTIILWLVLSLTVWSGLRLVSAIQWWHTLLEFSTPPGPLYIAISGGVWLLLSFVLFRGMWHSKAWTQYALLGTGAGITVWYWCDRLILQTPRANWLFALIANIFLLIILSICTLAPATKTFLLKREAHD